MDSILYEQHSDADHHIYFAHSYGGNCPAHFHQASEILFVLKEKIVVTINDETRVLSPGELAVIPSYYVHSFRCPQGTEAYVFTISQSVIYKLQEYMQIISPYFLSKSDYTQEIREWLQLCEEKWQGSNFIMRYGLVNYFVGLLHKGLATSQKIAESDNIVPKIFSYIETHYTEDLTLSFLSAHFGYSKNHFSTLFNRITNMHLTEYINRVRVLHAKQELNNPDNKATTLQIATKHGFNSLNTFYRALKKCNLS